MFSLLLLLMSASESFASVLGSVDVVRVGVSVGVGVGVGVGVVGSKKSGRK